MTLKRFTSDDMCCAIPKQYDDISDIIHYDNLMLYKRIHAWTT